ARGAGGGDGAAGGVRGGEGGDAEWGDRGRDDLERGVRRALAEHVRVRQRVLVRRRGAVCGERVGAGQPEGGVGAGDVLSEPGAPGVFLSGAVHGGGDGGGAAAVGGVRGDERVAASGGGARALPAD